MNDIAIYICCWGGDSYLVKTLCESIRYFCGSIPIFLIKDGDFSTAQVRTLGAIFEFDLNKIPEKLRGLKGWSIKKLYAFYQRDFKRFLYLDSDIVLLNNPFLLSFKNYDFYVDTSGFKDVEGPQPGIRFRGNFPMAASPYTFNPAKLCLFDPVFNLEDVLLFNAGQIFGQSGLLDMNSVMHCVGELERGNDLFFWDQGILNYLLNKGHQEGRFTLGGECFRIPGYDPPENWPTLTARSVLDGTFHDRTLIHWAGPSKRGKEIPYGSILETFRTLYYRRFHPLAYPHDVARQAFSGRFRGMAQRLRRVMSALQTNR